MLQNLRVWWEPKAIYTTLRDIYGRGVFIPAGSNAAGKTFSGVASAPQLEEEEEEEEVPTAPQTNSEF